MENEWDTSCVWKNRKNVVVRRLFFGRAAEKQAVFKKQAIDVWGLSLLKNEASCIGKESALYSFVSRTFNHVEQYSNFVESSTLEVSCNVQITGQILRWNTWFLFYVETFKSNFVKVFVSPDCIGEM